MCFVLLGGTAAIRSGGVAYDANLETVLTDLLDGQFTTAEGWSRDVSEDIANELSQRCIEQRRDLPSSLVGFVARYHLRHHDVR